MSAPLAPYNVSLTASSSLFSYAPFRDGDATAGWNASYTGRPGQWPPNVDPAGTAFRRTQYGGAKVSLALEGTGFYLCFTAGGAPYALSLDGKDVDQNSVKPALGTACGDLEAESMYASSGLQFGTHTAAIAISASPSSEFHFFGGGIEMRVNTRGAPAAAPVTFDDQDAAWAITPGRKPAVSDGWDKASSPRLYQQTATFVCPYGPSDIAASYKFIGYGGVVLNGYVWGSAHSFSVDLDGVTFNMDASSSWFDGSAVFLAKGNLDPTTPHTVTIHNFNSDDPNCPSESGHGNCCIGFDSLVLLQAATGDSTSTTVSSIASGTGLSQTQQTPADSHKSIVGPVVGGILGGLLLAALVVVVFIFFRRRRRSRRDSRPDLDASVTQYIGQPWTGEVTSYNPLLPAQGTLSDGPNGTQAAAPRPSGKQRIMSAHSAGHETVSSPISGSVSGTTSTGGEQPRLAQEDLERVLAFVSQRMDPTQPLPDAPPQYHG